jgi:hypothetical protein
MPGYGIDHTMEARNLLQQLTDAARKVQDATAEANKATDETVKSAFTVVVAEYQSRVDDIKTKLIASITTIAHPSQ